MRGWFYVPTMLALFLGLIAGTLWQAVRAGGALSARLEDAVAGKSPESAIEGTAVRAPESALLVTRYQARPNVVAFEAFTRCSPVGPKQQIYYEDFQRRVTRFDLWSANGPVYRVDTRQPTIEESIYAGRSASGPRRDSGRGGTWVERWIAEGDTLVALGRVREVAGVRGFYDPVVLRVGTIAQWRSAPQKGRDETRSIALAATIGSIVLFVIALAGALASRLRRRDSRSGSVR